MVIIVLGGGIRPDGSLPELVYPRLEAAYALHKKTGASIITSGRYSYLWEKPFPKSTESAAMRRVLIKMGVPAKKIKAEQRSKDTISNAYYLKKMVRDSNLTVITSNFHIQRTRFIFKKIFGQKFTVRLVAVEQPLSKAKEKQVVARQAELLKKTRAWLSAMKDGDHRFLDGAFFSAPYFQADRPAWVKSFVAKGK